MVYFTKKKGLISIEIQISEEIFMGKMMEISKVIIRKVMQQRVLFIRIVILKMEILKILLTIIEVRVKVILDVIFVNAFTIGPMNVNIEIK